MQLSLKQLNTHLNQKLSSLYLISGDEPLLIQEARDAISIAAKSQGFLEKEICYVDSGFSTETLSSQLFNRSLFCEKKLMDIRNPAAKFDTAMITLIQDYLAHPLDDYLMIISTDKLTAVEQKSAWCEVIKKCAVFLPIWPIPPNELSQWIIERAAKFQLLMSSEMARLLAAYSEGNLLSTQQALEKLHMLYPKHTITREQLMTVLTDHARFNIFDLSECLFQNKPKKIIRIVDRLKQTGEEPALVLWAVCRKLRERSGSASDHAINSNIQKSLQQAAHVDEIIKGAKSGDVWQVILELCLCE